MKVKDYKPHIDGLRALAVLPVIFFHAGYSFFQAEDGIRDVERSRGLGDVYKRQSIMEPI